MLEIKDISFRFSEKPVLDRINFTAVPGEIISVIGESGSGKSTLLRAIYGLYDLDSGEICWKDKKILGPSYNLVPGEPGIKYLAQDFDLMPYITVSENVGKFLSNFYPEEKSRRINELLDMVELTEYAQARPDTLSGGQQQRVALARAMAQQPGILLLDEPFSHIDSFRKNKLRRDLFSFIRKKGITCIIATHDSVDALSHADKTLVIKDGRITRKDRPEHLYQRPGNKYTASLFGEANEIPLQLLLPAKKNGQSNSYPNQKVIVYSHELSPAEKSALKVRVKESYFEGGRYLIRGLYHGETLFFNHPTPISPEETVYLKADEQIVKERLKPEKQIS